MCCTTVKCRTALLVFVVEGSTHKTPIQRPENRARSITRARFSFLSSRPTMGQGPDVVPGANRPRDLALRQQRLKAWKPILDPKWVIAALLIIAAIFIPVGKSVRVDTDTGAQEAFSSPPCAHVPPPSHSFALACSLQAECHVG